MATTAAFKNINMLTKAQYDGVSSPATDELYAISGSGFGLPSSSRYQALTLGSSGASYTAPANGWVLFSKQVTASGQYIQANHAQFANNAIASASGQTLMLIIPVLKGTFTVSYNAAGSTGSFKFIYAEGE